MEIQFKATIDGYWKITLKGSLKVSGTLNLDNFKVAGRLLKVNLKDNQTGRWVKNYWKVTEKLLEGNLINN